MIKRILLLALALLLLQGVCLAKIEKQVDDFDGSYGYYVNYRLVQNDSSYHFIRIRSTFNILFNSNNTFDSMNFIVDFRENGVYAIEPLIKFKIDNKIYTWVSSSPSTRDDDSADLVWSLPSNVYEALMNTKQDVVIRFNYRSLDGNYRNDYTIPYTTIQEVQTMYKTYYKPPVKQVAK